MEVTDYLGLPTIFRIEATPIQSGLEGDVYRGIFGKEGATTQIAAKKLKTPINHSQLEIEIDLVKKLRSCDDSSQGIVCFKGVIANKTILDSLEAAIGIEFRPFRYELEGPDVYIISNLLEGRELFDYIVEGALTDSQKISIMKQLLTVLAKLHANGIVHGDIKPENIFYNHKTDLLTVYDFGFACKRDVCNLKNKGTLQYMSPEQLIDIPMQTLPQPKNPFKVDIFAAGQILFILLMGAGYIAYTENIKLADPHDPKNGRRFQIQIVTATKKIDNLLHKDLIQTYFLAKFSPALYDLFTYMINKRPLARPTAEEALGILQELERTNTLYAGSATPLSPSPPLIRQSSTQYGGRSRRRLKKQTKRRDRR